jgi:class 3 adenylate cyclase
MGATATTATVLFTDLVGSTALRLQLGEQAFEALRHAHDQMVREAIAAHGGTLVKGLGDGLMASFAGAADAVDAAVAVQQAIDVYNRKATSALAVRVGVSAGDVTWEGGDCYGLAVVEASRLCAAADGGAILVSEVVRMMAHGRGGWSFGAVSGLDLKGLTDPLPARSVLWEPLSARTSVPLPPRLVTSYQVGLFGRATEQELIARCWQEAKEGQRRVVLLAGEPGIGKTRLATESALAAHADGAILLFGWSDEDLGVPYRPFVEALRHYVAHAPVDVLQGHVREHKGELARLVPELAAHSRPTFAAGGRGGDRTVSAIRGRRRAIVRSVAATASRDRPRRSAVGGHSRAVAPQAPRPFDTLDAATRCEALDNSAPRMVEARQPAGRSVNSSPMRCPDA